MQKKTEPLFWHEITIEMVNKDANCSFEVLTPQADKIVDVVSDPDVVALSWRSESRCFLVRTSQITRVIVESLNVHALDAGEREELLETATKTTASVIVRTLSADAIGEAWTPLWEVDDE